MNTFLNYINASIVELRQVRWPTRQQAVRFSAIVIGFTLICAIGFGAIDLLLSTALKALLTFAS